MADFEIYKVNSEYCDYLRQFDKRVPINNAAYNKDKRPFIGIIVYSDKNKYFAPLSSPKPKHLKMPSNALDCLKIDKGRLGIINFNNMIPVNMSDVEVLDLSKKTNIPVSEQKYLSLLRKQKEWCNENLHKKAIIKKAERLYNGVSTKRISAKVINRCCDFKLLEKYCLKWNNEHNIKILKQPTVSVDKTVETQKPPKIFYDR